ncbi:MAG: glycosyltransferase family 4 protein [Anaerolineae bacterium]|nr:glycosyltransferase family 4 protein [Anaerolineae bacterium]
MTGSTRNVDLSRFPASEHVHFTGYLDDIKPTLARSWACVVPVRHGSGTRLKILEAMAAGVPVVSTTKGAEGLEVTPGRDLLIADEPAAFADAVLRVLGDTDLRQSLAEAGRQIVTRRYDWSIIGDRLLAFVDEVCAVG